MISLIFKINSREDERVYTFNAFRYRKIIVKKFLKKKYFWNCECFKLELFKCENHSLKSETKYFSITLGI